MEKMNKFTKKAAEMEAWGALLDFATNQVERCLESKRDENGNEVLDEDGNPIMVPPTEDRCYDYPRYIGWSEVVKTLENMKI